MSYAFGTRHASPPMDWAGSPTGQQLVTPKIEAPLLHHWVCYSGSQLSGTVACVSPSAAYVVPSVPVRIGLQGRDFWVNPSPKCEVCAVSNNRASPSSSESQQGQWQ